MEWFLNPWPWWISGILIGLVVPMLYIFAGKPFGISTSLQQLGSMCSPNSRLEYFSKFDRRTNAWTLFFIVGIAIGAFIGTRLLSAEHIALLPAHFTGIRGGATLLVGGFLIGFGTRYAGGCTSGHSITGIANLNGPSLLATICFFIGGLAVTWGLGSLLFDV